MLLVILGVVLLVLRVAGYGPVEAWPWWALAAPFAGAIVWWMYADASGLTQRMAMARYEARRALRRRKMMELLGLVIPGRPLRSAAAASPSAAPAAAARSAEQPPEPPTAAARKARSGEDGDFSDTVPSLIDVPEDLAESRPDWRRIE